MTTDPFRDEDPVNGPIDAQFEPAPAGTDRAARAGPGWIAPGAAAALAALIGSVAGIYGADYLRPNSAPELAAAQKRFETRLDEVTALQAAIDQKLSEPAAASAELASLIGELDAVSRRLDQAIAAGGDPAALAAVTARLDALEGRAPHMTVSAGGEVAALTSRLASLEASTRAAAAETSAAIEQSGNRAEAALALSAIEAAARRGNGFEADYRALRNAAPGNDPVKRLAPYVSGVTALAALQAEFSAVHAAVLVAGAPATTSARLSWIDRMFGDAVSVRPAHGQHSAMARALDAAAASLAAGDLAGSVKALGGLDANAARAAEDWTRRANRRITLEEALEDVRLSLLEGGN